MGRLIPEGGGHGKAACQLIRMSLAASAHGQIVQKQVTLWFKRKIFWLHSAMRWVHHPTAAGGDVGPMSGNISAKPYVSAKTLLKRGGVRLGTRLLGPFGVFLQGALQEPGMVGAVFPSSKATITGMLKKVDWEKARLVVEYGPGVGTFSKPLLEHLPKDATLLAIDTNPHFIEHLGKTITDQRFKAVLGSATDVERIVAQAGFEEADIVISGLPVSTLPPDVAEEMVEATYRVLQPGGAFLTYQYRLTARRLTEQAFDRVDTKYVLMNVPPDHLTWGWKAA